MTFIRRNVGKVHTHKSNSSWSITSQVTPIKKHFAQKADIEKENSYHALLTGSFCTFASVNVFECKWRVLIASDRKLDWRCSLDGSPTCHTRQKKVNIIKMPTTHSVKKISLLCSKSPLYYCNFVIFLRFWHKLWLLQKQNYVFFQAMVAKINFVAVEEVQFAIFKVPFLCFSLFSPALLSKVAFAAT